MKTKVTLLLFAIVFIATTPIAAQTTDTTETPDNAYSSTIKLKFIKKRTANNKIGVFEGGDTTTPLQFDVLEIDSIKQALVINFIKNPLDTTADYSQIKKVVNEIHRLIIPLEASESEAQSNKNKKLVSSMDNLASASIDGLAKFLAERFKQDVTTLYINSFRNTLRKEPFNDFAHLTPETYTYFMENDLFKFKDLGDDIRRNFRMDLDSILIGLRDLVENGNTTRKFREKKGEEYEAIFFSLDLAQQLRGKKSFFQILEYLETTYKPKNDFKKYYNLIHTVTILKENLRRKEENGEKQFWLTAKDLDALDEVKDYEYFISFVYNDGTNKEFFDEMIKKLSSEERKKTGLVKEYISSVIKIYQSIESIQAKKIEIKINVSDEEDKKDKNKELLESYVELFSNFADLLELMNTKGEFLNEGAIIITKQSIIIAKTFLKKNYADIVPAGSKILEQILKDNGNKAKIVAKFEKYGFFMADIATAEDSDDIKDAIARNVTDYSYTDKRKNTFSFIVNADPGIVPGNEEFGNNPFKSGKFTLGITAPIGFDAI